MTDNRCPTLHLCLLLHAQSGDRARQAIKSSLSCLADHTSVRVSLIAYAGLHSAATLNRITARFTDELEIVASEAFAKTSQEYTASEHSYFYLFLPAGDWLSDNALSKIAAVAHAEQPDIIYTDEDRIDSQGRLSEPLFKPDAAPEFFLHSDYVGALLCIKKSALAQLGGIDPAHYLKERYRLLLSAFTDGRPIAHIAQPLYHARPRRESSNAAAVLTRHCRERDLDVGVEKINGNVYRLNYKVTGNPKVSIIIPFRDKPQLLRQCLDAVMGRTEFQNFEVIGVSNRSQSLTIYELMRQLSRQDRRIRFFEHNVPFNFSALVNFGVGMATGKFIVLMNNDVTVINSGWLHAMLEHGQREKVGVVGAKLLYPNDTIQHAGISVQKSGYIAHLHKHFPAHAKGYMNRLICVQNVSAVTAALCLFKIELHDQLNGFDANRFKIAFNDVDFCLRAEGRGYRNVFTPHARAYHHESISRGYETSAEKKDRFALERKHFAEIYAHRLSRGDPYYNPNLNQNRDDFSY